MAVNTGASLTGFTVMATLLLSDCAPPLPLLPKSLVATVKNAAPFVGGQRSDDAIGEEIEIAHLAIEIAGVGQLDQRTDRQVRLVRPGQQTKVVVHRRRRLSSLRRLWDLPAGELGRHVLPAAGRRSEQTLGGDERRRVLPLQPRE